MDEDPIIAKAAALGEPHAQFQLGFQLLFGISAKVDHPRAVEWLERSAAQGHIGAQGLLGIALYPDIDSDRPPLKGSTYEDDRRVAEKWFKKALPQLRKLAKSQEPMAVWILGFMYERGVIVTQDLEEARKQYQIAGEDGLPMAAHRAAFLAVKMADWPDAFYWSLIAEKLGVPKSKSYRKLVQSFLKKDELNLILKRAGAWQPSSYTI